MSSKDEMPEDDDTSAASGLPGSTKKAIGRRIKLMRQAAGLTQKELASKIQTSQGTVNKWESAITMPGGQNLTQLANAFGVTEKDIFGLTPDASAPAGRRVRVVGEVSAGDWREAVAWPEDEQDTYAVQLPPKFDGIPVEGYIVRGDSMNKIYPDRSIVYVAPIRSLPGAPLNGQVVLVISKDKSGMYEATLKEYVVESDGSKWLWPRSDSPLHQAPIDYKRAKTGGVEEVAVVGAVIGAMVFPRV